MIDEKEILILDLISKNASLSQRQVARMSGISLGLINVRLKHLINNGYIQVKSLNKRKMHYLLTKEGRLESAKHSHRSVVNTIKKYQSIKNGLSNLFKELRSSGYDYFSIQGDGDLRVLVEKIFLTCLGEQAVTLGKEHRYQPRSVVLDITGNEMSPDFPGDVVDVLSRIGV